jgi:hypothetical protein
LRNLGIWLNDVLLHHPNYPANPTRNEVGVESSSFCWAELMIIVKSSCSVTSYLVGSFNWNQLTSTEYLKMGVLLSNNPVCFPYFSIATLRYSFSTLLDLMRRMPKTWAGMIGALINFDKGVPACIRQSLIFNLYFKGQRIFQLVVSNTSFTVE